MAIGPIEMQGTIARAQDYSTIKQNEDYKGIIDQNNFQNQFKKEVNERPHQVNNKDNADYQNKKFDAKDKGSGEYAGDGGKERKDKKGTEGRVVLKGNHSFDIKI